MQDQRHRRRGQPCGQRQGDLGAVVHLDQGRAQLPQRPCDGGSVAEIGVAQRQQGRFDGPESNAREDRAILLPPEYDSIEARSLDQAAGQQADGSGAGRGRTLRAAAGQRRQEGNRKTSRSLIELPMASCYRAMPARSGAGPAVTTARYPERIPDRLGGPGRPQGPPPSAGNARSAG